MRLLKYGLLPSHIPTINIYGMHQKDKPFPHNHISAMLSSNLLVTHSSSHAVKQDCVKQIVGGLGGRWSRVANRTNSLRQWVSHSCKRVVAGTACKHSFTACTRRTGQFHTITRVPCSLLTYVNFIVHALTTIFCLRNKMRYECGAEEPGIFCPLA